MRAAAQGWGSDRYTQIELEFNVGICCFTLSVAFFVNFSWGTGGGERQGGGGGGGEQPQVSPCCSVTQPLALIQGGFVPAGKVKTPSTDVGHRASPALERL